MYPSSIPYIMLFCFAQRSTEETRASYALSYHTYANIHSQLHYVYTERVCVCIHVRKGASGSGGVFGAVKELCHNDLMGPKGGKRWEEIWRSARVSAFLPLLHRSSFSRVDSQTDMQHMRETHTASLLPHRCAHAHVCVRTQLLCG